MPSPKRVVAETESEFIGRGVETYRGQDLGKFKAVPHPPPFHDIPQGLLAKWEAGMVARKLTAREVFTLATVHGLVAQAPEGGFAEALVEMLRS